MRHIGSHSIDRGFTDPVRDVFTIFFSSRGRKVNNQARLLLHHHSGSIATSNVMGSHPNREHAVPEGRRKFPECGVETTLLTALFGLITVPGIIHEQIKPALLSLHAVKHSTDLRIITMITV